MWRCTQSPDPGCCGIAMCTACALGPPAWPRRLWTTPFPSHLDFCFCSEKNTAFILKLLSMLLPPLIGDNTDCQYCLGGKFNRYENPRLLFFLEVSEEPCYLFPVPPSCSPRGMAWSTALTKSSLLPSATAVPPAGAEPGAEQNVSS